MGVQDERATLVAVRRLVWVVAFVALAHLALFLMSEQWIIGVFQSNEKVILDTVEDTVGLGGNGTDLQLAAVTARLDQLTKLTSDTKTSSKSVADEVAAFRKSMEEAFKLLQTQTSAAAAVLKGAPADAQPSGKGSEGKSDQGVQNIPHIIHQIWNTNDIPEKFKAWQQGWKDLHPKWEYRLWIIEDQRKLIADHYPWFLKTFDAFPKLIMRADAVRPFIMHHHGGVYADLDVEAIKPMDELVDKEHGIVLAHMSSNWKHPHNIPNAWMASVPGHMYWMFCAAHMMHEFRPDQTEEELNKQSGIEKVTGPVAFKTTLATYFEQLGKDGVTVLAPGIIFPYSWLDADKRNDPKASERVKLCSMNDPSWDAAACKKLFPDAFAITYWAHSWGEDQAEKKSRKLM